jgi:hypothetical protein
LRYVSLFFIAGVLAALPFPAAAADACSLISRADASTLLSQPVNAGTADGPARDEDSSGQLSYCTYRGATASVLVSVVEFSSPAEAKKELTINLVKRRMDEDDAKVSEEPGIGERSFYAVSPTGSMYVFLKGNKVVALALGGSAAPKAAAIKAPLKADTMAIAAKF